MNNLVSRTEVQQLVTPAPGDLTHIPPSVTACTQININVLIAKRKNRLKRWLRGRARAFAGNWS